MSEITEPAVPAEPVEGATPADEQLGEPGLAALKSEREARKSAEKERAELAARIKEFEDRDKSEAEKQAEEAEQLRRENAELKSAKTLAEVASAKQVPADLVAGPVSNSPEDLAAFADALIAFRGEQPKPRLYLPNEGKQPRVSGGSTADLFADFIEDKLK